MKANRKFRKLLLPILEEMVKAAENNDQYQVQVLGSKFSNIYMRDYLRNGEIMVMTEEEKEYDNCRQSCVLSLQANGQRDAYIKDALERLEKIRIYAEKK